MGPRKRGRTMVRHLARRWHCTQGKPRVVISVVFKVKMAPKDSCI